MKKTICILCSLLLAGIFVGLLALPGTAEELADLNVPAGETQTFSSEWNYRDLSVPSGSVLTVEKETKVSFHGVLTLSGSVVLDGMLTGEVTDWTLSESGSITLGKTGWLSLTFSGDPTDRTDALVAMLENCGAKVTAKDGRIIACHPDHSHTYRAFCEDCEYDTASALSRGDVTIVCCVAAAVVFFLIGMAVDKKTRKK